MPKRIHYNTHLPNLIDWPGDLVSDAMLLHNGETPCRRIELDATPSEFQRRVCELRDTRYLKLIRETESSISPKLHKDNRSRRLHSGTPH